MTIIKRKSLVVALVSSFIIGLVLVLTLVGYLAYIELKGNESKRAYQYSLQKVNAKTYAKYVDIQKLKATIENSGALKGKPIVGGILTNKGYRGISDIVIKVKFLDRDGATIYNAIFHPQEPALGASAISLDRIPYLSSHAKTAIGPSGSLPFKTILAGCPSEIIKAVKEDKGFADTSARWTGKLLFEVVAIDF